MRKLFGVLVLIVGVQAVGTETPCPETIEAAAHLQRFHELLHAKNVGWLANLAAQELATHPEIRGRAGQSVREKLRTQGATYNLYFTALAGRILDALTNEQGNLRIDPFLPDVGQSAGVLPFSRTRRAF